MPKQMNLIWFRILLLLNDNDCFMSGKLIPSPIPEYDNHYGIDEARHLINYIFHINREALFEDLFKKLASYD